LPCISSGNFVATEVKNNLRINRTRAKTVSVIGKLSGKFLSLSRTLQGELGTETINLIASNLKCSPIVVFFTTKLSIYLARSANLPEGLYILPMFFLYF